MRPSSLCADLRATKKAAVRFMADRLGATWLPLDGLPSLHDEIEEAYRAWLERTETRSTSSGSIRTLHDFFVERYLIESAFFALDEDLPD
jgi:hypothetical protein